MLSYDAFLRNLEQIRERIRQACEDANRPPSSVRILPVTKSQTLEAIGHVARAGLLSVGENRVQEAIQKMPHSPHELRWELIGHLQSNKAKVAAQSFARIQSVDSTRIIDLLDRSAAAIGKRLPILLQVNTGDDSAKFGANSETSAPLLEYALNRTNLQVEGLMVIAPHSENAMVARRAFAKLRELRDALQRQFGVPLPELSMGMSGDFEQAVREGSTTVRLGTALFDARIAQ